MHSWKMRLLSYWPIALAVVAVVFAFVAADRRHWVALAGLLLLALAFVIRWAKGYREKPDTR